MSQRRNRRQRRPGITSKPGSGDDSDSRQPAGMIAKGLPGGRVGAPHDKLGVFSDPVLTFLRPSSANIVT